MADPSDAEVVSAFNAAQTAPAAPQFTPDEQALINQSGVPADATVVRNAQTGALSSWQSPSQGMGVFVGAPTPAGPAVGAPDPTAGGGASQAPASADPPDAEVVAAFQKANPQAAGPGDGQAGAAPQPNSLSSPQAFVQNFSNGARDLLNAATFGSVDRLNSAIGAVPAAVAAIPAAASALTKIPSEGFAPLSAAVAPVAQAFSQNMDQQRALDNNHPGVAHTVNGLVGGLAQAAALPEVEAPSLIGRAVVGAGQGGLLGALDGIGNARGGPSQMLKAGYAPAAIGGLIGGPLGMALGAGGKAIRQIASMADYARAGVDPMLAVNGPQSVQRVAQMVKGLPFVGAPINAAAQRTTQQAQSAVGRIAGSYGDAASAADAGAPIIAANHRSAAAQAAAQGQIEQAVSTLANRFGGSGQRRVIGENLQDGVKRFAQGESGASSVGAARNSSFSQKANQLYGDAFGRLDSEMTGKTSAPVSVAKPKMYDADNTERVGGSQITTPRTTATLHDITGSAQSPAIAGVIKDPTIARVADALGRANAAKDMSFDDLRSLRTWVRLAQKNTDLRQTIGAANLQRLEGSLTADIRANAERLGSAQAAQMLKRADQFYAAGSARIKNALEPFFDAHSGEAAYDRVMAAASHGAGADVARLRALQRSLRPVEWNEVSSSLVAHMGEGPEGFSLAKFVQNYSKLSPEGGSVLFGGRNAELGDALADVVSQGRRVLAIKPDVHFADTPNAAFEGLMSAARARGRTASVSSIQDLRSALSEPEWGDVVSGVIRVMGQEGEHINLNKFATEWNKMSANGREALFGGPGREESVKDLDALVRVAQQQKAADKFYNHSNSGHMTAGVLVADRVGEYVMEGHLHDLPHVLFHDIPAVAALYGVAAGAAHLLASPGFARLVLRASKAETPGSQKAVDQALVWYANDNQPVARQVMLYRDELAKRFKANVAVTAGVDVPAQMRRNAASR